MCVPRSHNNNNVYQHARRCRKGRAPLRLFKPCGLLGGRRELHADAKTNPKLKVKVKGSPDKHSKAGANRQRGDNKETTRRQEEAVMR